MLTLYSAIKTIAENRKTSISKIERDLHMSNGAISKWDKSMPRANSLENVAGYLGVTTQYLFQLAREDSKAKN